MTQTKLMTALLVTTALSACGGGGGGSDSDNFYFGSEGASTNGLPYATSATTLADADGETVTIPFVYATYDNDTGEKTLVLSRERLTLPAGSNANSYNDVTVTFDGQTVIFSDGTGTIDGDGSLTFSASENSDFVSLINIYGDLSDTPDVDMDGMAVIGFQTDPSTIASLSGPVTYSGEFAGWGNYSDSNNDVISQLTNLSGAMTIDVDFTAASVSGRLDPSSGELFYYAVPGENSENTVEGYFSFDTDLVGNGFSGNLDLTCTTTGVTCTGGGEIGGAFYGPDADNVAGLYKLEGSVELNGDADTRTEFSHPGGFFADVPSSR